MIVDVSIHVKAKNKNELTNKITREEVINSVKYNTDFDYIVHFFSKTEAVITYKIDIKQAAANNPQIIKRGK